MGREILTLKSDNFDRDEFKKFLESLMMSEMGMGIGFIRQSALGSAMRVVPLLGSAGHLNFWPANRRLIYLRAILEAAVFPKGEKDGALDVPGVSANARAAAVDAHRLYAAGAPRAAVAAARAAARAASIEDVFWEGSYGVAIEAAVETIEAAIEAAVEAAPLLYNALKLEVQKVQESGAELKEGSLWWGAVPAFFTENLRKLESIFLQLPRIDGDEEDWYSIDDRLNRLWHEAGLSRPSSADLGHLEEAVNQRLGEGADNSRYAATNQSHPENPSTTDKLNRQNLVNALAANLIHSTNKHHRAIGLLGEWGSGKSTLLKLLKEKLQKTHTEQPFVFGEFNAWAYEHTDNIQAGVAQEMINALTSLPDTLGSGISSFWPSLKWGVQRAGLTMQFSWKTHPFEILKILVLLLIAAIPWFSDWFDSLINNKDLAIVGQWVWTGGLVLYTLREFGKLIISPQAKELLTYLRLPSYAEHLGKIPVMRKHISTLCELRLKEKNGKTPRLLFVVDDLDRCSPEAIVKVLEAVRLVLDLENVIVLIAIDQHIALAALSKHFKDFALHHKLKNSHAIAREYLSKVINLPIVLTAPSGKDVEVFMADLWKDMPKVSPEGASSASQKAPFDKTPEPGTGEANPPLVDSTSQPDNVPVPDGTPNPGLTDDVKPTAPESDQPPSGEINPIKALSLEQQASFIHWVNYFELTNPRQLKRLNNSYDLMRSYFVEWDKTPVAFNFPNENAQPVYPMLLTLILMEHLNSFEDLDARGRLWKKLFPQKSEGSIPVSENITRVDPGAFDKKSVSPAFINAYRELYKLEGYDDMAAKVEAFVLPAMV